MVRQFKFLLRLKRFLIDGDDLLASSSFISLGARSFVGQEMLSMVNK